MKRYIILLFGCFYILMAAACSHIEGYLDIVRQKGISEEYLTVLAKWTRSQILYSQFETQTHISATYKNTEFQRAYFKEYSKIYHLQEEEARRGVEIQKRKASNLTEFIFYAYVPEKSSNDFDKQGSIWTVFLVNERGDRIDPVEIRRIEPVTAIIKEFFPYINPHYGIAYHLRFPSFDDSGGDIQALKLVFASVIGEVILKFEGH